jgi:hypothetical protein
MAMPILPESRSTREQSASDLAGLMQPPANMAKITSIKAIRSPPNYPFLYRVHPSAWTVESEGLDGPTLLPEIGKHLLIPGCNGVRTLSDNEKTTPERAYEDAVAAAQGKGWTYIALDTITDAKHLPPGVPAGPFLREIPCRHPQTGIAGSRWVEAWSVPVATLPDDEQAFQFDRASYNRWRLSLVESGKIPAPNAVVVSRLKARIDGQHARIQSRVATDPHVKEANLAKAKAASDAVAVAAAPKARKTPAPAPAGAK